MYYLEFEIVFLQHECPSCKLANQNVGFHKSFQWLVIHDMGEKVPMQITLEMSYCPYCNKTFPYIKNIHGFSKCSCWSGWHMPLQTIFLHRPLGQALFQDQHAPICMQFKWFPPNGSPPDCHQSQRTLSSWKTCSCSCSYCHWWEACNDNKLFDKLLVVVNQSHENLNSVHIYAVWDVGW